MAIDKKQLLKLLQNPGMMSADEVDVAPEEIESDLAQQVQGGDEVEAMPMDEEEEAPAPSMQDKYTPDPAILQQLKKLKQGPDSLDDVQVAQESINDPEAPMELRKEAIKKIRQKYLGQ